MKEPMVRKSKDGLVSKVWRHQPIRDEEGKQYIPFCTFKYHVGISMFPKVCESRNCTHYRRLYVELQNTKL